jgi:DNA-binding CsgD family transcriptional regulator
MPLTCANSVVLREALSNQNRHFVKLSSIASFLAQTNRGQASPQVNAPESRQYHMTRRLTPAELEQVIELYRLGLSTYKLARQFGTDRHTITGHLRRGDVTLRSRQKLTLQLTETAVQLYANGHSLATIGKQFGLSPTTIGTALKKAGVELRDNHGRPT